MIETHRENLLFVFAPNVVNDINSKCFGLVMVSQGFIALIANIIPE
jgi:hypothetical protein